jgi:hypothetical protein
MRSFIQSLLATAIIALPAGGTSISSDPGTGAVTAVSPTTAATDLCAEAVAEVAAVYAWHISNFMFCPVGLCIPLVEASGYALLIAAAYAVTVCAF